LFSDNCIFIHDEYGVIIVLYVDNLLMFGKIVTKVDNVKGLLSNEFEIKDMGELKYILGIQVHHD
jgi:Reverse transcriptase (RNA-dependent DNA polymerase)